jgi:molybdopterin synthase sulfur carrier subunit
MRIRVDVYFPFREELGNETIELELPAEATVETAVATLADRYSALCPRLYDAQGRLARYVSVLVNGTSVQFKLGLATPLSDGDRLTILPPVGGG